jgi:hypothetical protein
VSARFLDAGDGPAVDRLIDAYPFKPYRHYRWLPRRRQTTVLKAEVDRILAADGRIAVIAGADAAAVVVLVRPLPWDTAFFGVPMARLEYVLRDAQADPAATKDAVGQALSACRAAGLRHITARADVADADAVEAFQANGFRLIDGLVTYISHPKRPPPSLVKTVGLVRPYEPRDESQVMEVTSLAYRGFRGRFHLDRHVPRDRADAFYPEWARSCLDGRMADRVYVADAGDGRLYGWASVKRVEPASTAGGAVIFAGSLGATRPDQPGAYAALIATAARDNHAQGALTEAPTQNFNFPMIRVLEAVGAAYARAEYTFHAWLE